MEHKLENPKRIKELNPLSTLETLGLKNGKTFCDIGSGTGIFTFAASELTDSDIFSVEISLKMQKILMSKKEEKIADNVSIKNNVSKVPACSCDIVMVSTVLHELEDTGAMAEEIKRILKKNGVLSIIEFHKQQAPMGPPVEKRISSEEISDMLKKHNFNSIKYFNLGENFYMMVFAL